MVDTAHLHGALGGFKRLGLTMFAKDAKAGARPSAVDGKEGPGKNWRSNQPFLLVPAVVAIGHRSTESLGIYVPMGHQARHRELAGNGNVPHLKFRLVGETASPEPQSHVMCHEGRAIRHCKGCRKSLEVHCIRCGAL